MRGDGARTTARVAGNDERASGEGLATLGRWNGGGCDHEPQGMPPWSRYRQAAVAASWPTAVGSAARDGSRSPPPKKRAGGREGGRARLGRGDFLASTYRRDRRRPPASGAPGRCISCLDSTLPAGESVQWSAERVNPAGVRGGGYRRASAMSASSGWGSAPGVCRAQFRPPPQGQAGWGQVTRRRASRSARRRRALPASSGRRASPGCFARGRERW